jgi:hypothetical protein
MGKSVDFALRVNPRPPARTHRHGAEFSRAGRFFRVPLSQSARLLAEDSHPSSRLLRLPHLAQQHMLQIAVKMHAIEVQLPL